MNPITQPSSLKYGAVPFKQIKPEHFIPALDAAIEKGRQVIQQIQKNPAGFDNSIRALEGCTEEYDYYYAYPPYEYSSGSSCGTQVAVNFGGFTGQMCF